MTKISKKIEQDGFVGVEPGAVLFVPHVMYRYRTSQYMKRNRYHVQHPSFESPCDAGAFDYVVESWTISKIKAEHDDSDYSSYTYFGRKDFHVTIRDVDARATARGRHPTSPILIHIRISR